MHAVLATVGLLATSALAQSVGKAVVINACSYEVYLYNTPAADGGFDEIDEVLQPNGSYNQTWTELTNGDGWSLKLSQSTAMSNIMQYEYTFHDDGIIWYDLSDVNGNPWDGNWEITAASASSTCTPKQQAYRYSTDDAYGMQACPQDSVITVTLCSGDESNDGAAASASSSVAAESSTLATLASSSTFSTPASSVATSYSYVSTGAATTSTIEASSTPVQTTTFATSTLSSSSVITTDPAGATITEVATAVVTDVVTATHWHHWPRHAAEHARRHAHA